MGPHPHKRQKWGGPVSSPHSQRRPQEEFAVSSRYKSTAHLKILPVSHTDHGVPMQQQEAHPGNMITKK
jgi:hypothetical protein